MLILTRNHPGETIVLLKQGVPIACIVLTHCSSAVRFGIDALGIEIKRYELLSDDQKELASQSLKIEPLPEYRKRSTWTGVTSNHDHPADGVPDDVL